MSHVRCMWYCPSENLHGTRSNTLRRIGHSYCANIDCYEWICICSLQDRVRRAKLFGSACLEASWTCRYQSQTRGDRVSQGTEGSVTDFGVHEDGICHWLSISEQDVVRTVITSNFDSRETVLARIYSTFVLKVYLDTAGRRHIVLRTQTGREKSTTKSIYSSL